MWNLWDNMINILQDGILPITDTISVMFFNVKIYFHISNSVFLIIELKMHDVNKAKRNTIVIEAFICVWMSLKVILISRFVKPKWVYKISNCFFFRFWSWSMIMSYGWSSVCHVAFHEMLHHLRHCFFFSFSCFHLLQKHEFIEETVKKKLMIHKLCVQNIFLTKSLIWSYMIATITLDKIVQLFKACPYLL